MTMHWIALAAAICSSLVGQILLKAGAESLAGAGFVEQMLRWQTMLGLCFYGMGAMLYIAALRKIPMSVALPCTAASYVVIALVGWWFFGEALGTQKVAAISLIAAGVLVLATA
ncbi:DMT family transporter [Roseococcus pinisoli]|uniref:EamA family transporter n=1 Tax=Roseococcus pinisoli TaxID=2835040 RepID=A0ABS5QDR7_9PROT|nr:SMR family transporter [Roseococcus pinisoli]MBS7811844.1 EamA family transporter [Roseococcus pinisoli]